jgi:hypothetical protein
MPVDRRLAHIEAHLDRLTGGLSGEHRPAWLRRTGEEHRLPVGLAVLAAIALQAFVPHNLTFRPWWLLPAIELILLVVIILFRQTKINRESTILRILGITLVAAASAATAYSAARLVIELVHNRAGSDSGLDNAGLLLRNGGAVWLTNVIVFALWYWEMDRGGPVARAIGRREHADFLFPQMATPEYASKDWEPTFVDYFYVSFTNATAFSPTDAMPLTRWAKMLMLFQSGVSLMTVALVVARAVNVLA